MKLADLKPARGSRRPTRRVGRGLGSGRGSYSGRGRKGAKARSGAGPRPGFEGGQTPLSKRLPFRRGVRAGGAVHTGGGERRRFEPVNLQALNRFPANAEVTPQTLREAGLVRGRGPVKILGMGALDRALVVKAQAFSRAAAAAIERAGGRAEVVP
ncbi:MAG TPA: 50S ribosomal protein L15 [bacterium]|nr:50S ribosomal protein L15 [bacterium]